jgi:hypothetical protein
MLWNTGQPVEGAGVEDKVPLGGTSAPLQQHPQSAHERQSAPTICFHKVPMVADWPGAMVAGAADCTLACAQQAAGMRNVRP